MAGDKLNPKPSTFVGSYSRFSFDPDKGYVAILKEQGVPMLDDEVNTMQLAMLSQFRRLGAIFIGDGSPDNGWKVVEHSPNINDFIISAGNFVIDGWVLTLTADTTYQAQPNNSGMPSLTTPGSPRTDTVYLDIWTDEVDGTEDSSIIASGFSRTSCRLKLFWAVRVSEGSTTVPSNGLGASNIFHWFSPLATLTRDANNTITAGEITDIRKHTRDADTVDGKHAANIQLVVKSGNQLLFQSATSGAETTTFIDAATASNYPGKLTANPGSMLVPANTFASVMFVDVSVYGADGGGSGFYFRTSKVVNGTTTDVGTIQLQGDATSYGGSTQGTINKRYAISNNLNFDHVFNFNLGYVSGILSAIFGWTITIWGQ